MFNCNSNTVVKMETDKIVEDGLPSTQVSS